MDAKKVSRLAGCLAAAAALAGCSGGSGDTGTGSLTLVLTDAPVHDVAEVWVQFDGVTLRRSGGPPIVIDFDQPVDVDLLTLTTGNSITLLDGEPIPAGHYQQLALHVKAEHDGTYDSYVVHNGGGQVELFVPSGAQTGLKLINGFTITANQETTFLIDWDTHQGLVLDPPGLPGYVLRPTLRIVDLTEYGILTGTVSDLLVQDASCTSDLVLDSGNSVYIYDALDPSEDPDDIDGSGPTPMATTRVAQQGTRYGYEVILSPGDYTVAFTCQARDDQPEQDDDITFVGRQDITIVNGATLQVDFE